MEKPKLSTPLIFLVLIYPFAWVFVAIHHLLIKEVETAKEVTYAGIGLDILRATILLLILL
jgi:hypothetical protein